MGGRVLFQNALYGLDCGCRQTESHWVHLCPQHQSEHDTVHARWNQDRKREAMPRTAHDVLPGETYESE